MTNAINLKIKFTKKHSTVLLLLKLRQHNQGTNEIESFVRNIQNLKTRKNMKRAIMKTKIQDARHEEMETRRKFKKELDYIKRKIGTNTEFYYRFNSLMQEEVEFNWREQKEKRRKKVKHLIKKWKNVRPTVPETYRGVTISTEALEEIFDEEEEHQERPALIYGGVELTETEQNILKLGPKFTTYGRIDKVQMEAASEVMADKIRWEMRSREEREGPWTEEKEWEDVEAKTVHNEADKTMDFSKLRVTDIPECRRITVPEPMEDRVEVVLANIKSRISEATDKYVKENCDDKGNIRKGNISKEETEAVRSLQEKVDKKEIIINMTDKSGRLSVDKPENYIESMSPHYRNDEEISMQEKNNIEKKLNGHCLQLGRILKVGERWKHWPRVQKALKNSDCHIPVLSGYVKDHKPTPEGQPPPARPVGGCDEANNRQLSWITNQIVTSVVPLQ